MTGQKLQKAFVPLPGGAQTNHPDSMRFDASGNLMTETSTNPCPPRAPTYTYDAENRIITATNSISGTSTYVYDASGQRVRKTTSTGTVDFLYDLGAHPFTEVSSTGGWNRGEIYAQGRHVGTYSGGTTGTMTFTYADWLGTERVRTNISGTGCETITNLPYGDNQVTSGSCGDPSPMHLTGKERDAESGLDNFGARYDSSSLGRFTSADPKQFTARHLASPQKWNKYAYVQNNPIIRVDPDGMDDFFVFRPLAKGTSPAWKAIQAEAPKHGNTVTIYSGAAATADRYLAAVQTPGAHVVDTGHTIENNASQAVGVLLSNNKGVGDPAVTTLPVNGQPGGPLVPVTSVQAADVAVIGCNSTNLAPQYSSTTFTGTQPTTNSAAEDAGAAAYTDTMARGGTVDQAAGAAQSAMQTTTDKANANPDRAMTYSKPQVCTTVNGKTTCH